MYTQLLSEGDNSSIVTSLPGTQRVQEFLIAQGVTYREDVINLIGSGFQCHLIK